MLYNRSLLVTYFMYSNVCILIPGPYFNPPHNSALFFFQDGSDPGYSQPLPAYRNKVLASEM